MREIEKSYFFASGLEVGFAWLIDLVTDWSDDTKVTEWRNLPAIREELEVH